MIINLILILINSNKNNNHNKCYGNWNNKNHYNNTLACGAPDFFDSIVSSRTPQLELTLKLALQLKLNRKSKIMAMGSSRIEVQWWSN